MEDLVRLTAVADHGEANLICSLLRVNGIVCFDRVLDMFGETAGQFGAWREIVVRRDDLEAARELLAAEPQGDEPA
jgi:Putative prokaryotic signal transducing protein